MLAELIATLDLGTVDLVGNDSGGAISQILAARRPECLRTMTLTNCDTHDNVLPEALVPFVDLCVAGGASSIFDPMVHDLNHARAFLAPTM